ncbi:MAG: hybrid sensor histidine kinase/response regulator [Pontiellaceae bacterium]|nr:hybrid sensor histidine kinase/response regulator [Pontiellaceae bacterium]MBN2784707.1 hybrid sensor histidine kinase/response regulator [Pontiellaceae bacterium]
MNRERPLILAVDDTPENLDVLVDLLGTNYRISVATNGKRALELAAGYAQPDLILLDIMMPGMDGFEVCRRLKEQEALRDIPVIFLSAIGQVVGKVKAFSYGGVDYVTKPFQPEELESRVATHITLRRMKQDLERQNIHLDELVRQKSRELAEAHDRLKTANATKGEFLNLLSHEFRTPANGLLGVAELLLDHCPRNDETDELRSMFDHTCERMLDTLDNALLLAKIHVSKEDFKVVHVPLSEVLYAAYSETFDQNAAVRLTLPVLPDKSVMVVGEESLVQSALQSLFQTAVALARPSTQVMLQFAEDDSPLVILRLSGQSDLLDEKGMDCFFDVSSTSRICSPAEYLGLRPVVAERIVALYGGFVALHAVTDTRFELEIGLKK